MGVAIGYSVSYMFYVNQVRTLSERIGELESRIKNLEMIVRAAGIGKGLSLGTIVFYDAEPPNASVRRPPEYSEGEDVWMQIEALGVSYVKVNNEYRVDLEWSIQIFDEFGIRLYEEKIEYSKSFPDKPEKITFKTKVSLDKPPLTNPGVYIVVILAYDRNSLQVAITANEYFVKPPIIPP